MFFTKKYNLQNWKLDDIHKHLYWHVVSSLINISDTKIKLRVQMQKPLKCRLKFSSKMSILIRLHLCRFSNFTLMTMHRFLYCHQSEIIEHKHRSLSKMLILEENFRLALRGVCNLTLQILFKLLFFFCCHYQLYHIIRWLKNDNGLNNCQVLNPNRNWQNKTWPDKHTHTHTTTTTMY